MGNSLGVYVTRSSYRDDEESLTVCYEKLETEVTNEQVKGEQDFVAGCTYLGLRFRPLLLS